MMQFRDFCVKFDTIARFHKIFPELPWLWPPQTSGYMEGLFTPTKYLSRWAWLYPLLIYELVRGLEKTFTGGLTLGSLNVRICRRVFLQTMKYWKCHLPGFTNWGLKFVISEGAKKVSHPGLTFTPPHFRISERTFKNLSRMPWLSGA